jgi:hypothetical protein
MDTRPRLQQRQQLQGASHVLSFEDDVRLDSLEDAHQQWPAGHDQVAHAGATVSQVSSADDGLEVLQAMPRRRALRE